MQACDHCGDEVVHEVKHRDKVFCCTGCQSVYKILHESGLEGFYKEGAVGVTQKNNAPLDYLSLPEVEKKALVFQSENRNVVNFILPTIHCASCVWLLEKLGQLHKGIIDAQVNFISKRLNVHYDPQIISLQEVGELLQKVGYPPQLWFEKKRKKNNSLIIKIGVAGFCFGNIMLLSFPDYLTSVGAGDFERYFSFLNLLLILPVLTYSSSVFYNGVKSALKARVISVDWLIVIGIVTLFTRSVFEIFWMDKVGYLDSLAGLVFFLLLGKWFQSKVYDQLSFERKNDEYLPLGVLVQHENSFEIKSLKDVENDNIIRLRHGEVNPFRGRIVSGSGTVDNSFITGESQLISLQKNDEVYCGSKIVGEAIDILVISKDPEELKLLWEDIEKKEVPLEEGNLLVTVFTFIVLAVAIGTLIYWGGKGWDLAFQGVTAVLIVACPCALALSAPTVYGILLRKWGRNGLFIKSANVINQFRDIQSVVFDKTGTLTQNSDEIFYQGRALTSTEKAVFKTLTTFSTHPIAKQVGAYLGNCETSFLNQFEEISGGGIQANFNGKTFRIGNAKWLNVQFQYKDSVVGLSIDEEFVGEFQIDFGLRSGVGEMIKKMKLDKHVYLVSGDASLDQSFFEEYFSKDSIYSGVDPSFKMDFVKDLKNQGGVMMVGDGLNDSLAFQTANLGIAVVEEEGAFFPKCDGVIDGGKVKYLNRFFNEAKHAKNVLLICYIFSMLYNIVGMYFAVSLNLTPLVAAVLMPLSSVTIVMIGAIGMSIKR